jgi:hypothetical protein
VDASGPRERENPSTAVGKESDTDECAVRGSSFCRTKSHSGCSPGVAAILGGLLLQRGGESDRCGHQRSRQVPFGVSLVMERSSNRADNRYCRWCVHNVLRARLDSSSVPINLKLVLPQWLPHIRMLLRRGLQLAR